MIIPIQLTYAPLAQVPKQNNKGDAGYDLYSIEPVVLPAGKRVLVKTGISVAIPDGYYGRIAPRSGLAFKYGIDVLAGVIDSTYRGEIGVILLNTGQDQVALESQSRIAQIIFEKCHEAEFQIVENITDISSIRGDKGFGSSGT